MNLENKKVLIVGVARSGISAARLAFSYGGQVFCIDKSQDAISNSRAEFENYHIRVEFLPYEISSLDDIDLVVLSPGVNPNQDEIVLEARERGIEVIGEMELAYRFSDFEKVIAVTGSNGKSTTTSLIGEILKADDRKAVVAGNIGRPLSDAVFGDRDIAVLEVSTFQTETNVDFKPDIGVLLNITPDHLNRHNTLKEYADLKYKLFENMTKDDYAVLNMDDQMVREYGEKMEDINACFFSRVEVPETDAYIEDGYIKVNLKGDRITEVIEVDEISLKGPHNLENVLASCLVSTIMEVSVGSLREVLRTFKPLEHRLEFVGELGGVKFYNDSKATNVESMRMALLSFDGKIVLIAGGLDKGGDFDSLRDIVSDRVSLAVLIGDAVDKIKKSWNGLVEIEKVEDMKEAVKLAYSSAGDEGVVLLSPGCASFDMFSDFEDRGRIFKEEVNKLSGVE